MAVAFTRLAISNRGVVRLWEGHNIHGIKEGCGPYGAGHDVRLQLDMYHLFRAK